MSDAFRRFLYYVPGNGLTPARAAALGLGHALSPELPFTARGCERGPDGAKGEVAAADGPPGRPAQPLGYLPDEGQTWRRCGSGAWWLGWTAAAPPRPADLLRAETLPGHWIELEDGEPWLVPVARRIDLVNRVDHGVVLPRGFDVDADGEWTLMPLPRFREFAERVEAIWQEFCAFVEEPAKGLDELRWLDTAAEALALNYRVSRWELATPLPRLTTVNVENVIAALLDVPTLLEVARRQVASGKAQAAASPGCDTASGAAAGSQPTPPATPTSSGSTPS